MSESAYGGRWNRWAVLRFQGSDVSGRGGCGCGEIFFTEDREGREGEEARIADGLTAGASGLLALVFPKDFGTVDQFVLKELRNVPGALDGVEVGNPKSIGKKAGAGLIRIMRDKAAELNRVFQSDDWTPRRVDLVLWALWR